MGLTAPTVVRPWPYASRNSMYSLLLKPGPASDLMTVGMPIVQATSIIANSIPFLTADSADKKQSRRLVRNDKTVSPYLFGTNRRSFKQIC